MPSLFTCTCTYDLNSLTTHLYTQVQPWLSYDDCTIGYGHARQKAKAKPTAASSWSSSFKPKRGKKPRLRRRRAHLLQSRSLRQRREICRWRCSLGEYAGCFLWWGFSNPCVPMCRNAVCCSALRQAKVHHHLVFLKPMALEYSYYGRPAFFSRNAQRAFASLGSRLSVLVCAALA